MAIKDNNYYSLIIRVRFNPILSRDAIKIGTLL